MKLEKLERHAARQQALSTAKEVLRVVALALVCVFVATATVFMALAVAESALIIRALAEGKTFAAESEALTREPAAVPSPPVVPAASAEAREEAEPAEEPEPEPPYALEDVIMLSQTVWAEARGLPPEEQALCVWTVLNRLDAGGWGSSIAEVIARPGQFAHDPSYPVTAEIKETVERELAAWAAGEEAKVLPPYATEPGYLYFNGRFDENGMPHNFFR
jgi:spore germination cell wall hydrolase CwlJ-like protein